VTAFAVAIVAAAAVTTSAAGSTPACRAAQLRGRPAGSSGAAGTIVLSISLTNRGTACTLRGYAGLRLMVGARRPLPTSVAHGGLAVLNQRPKTVRLARGTVATILIAYSDVPTGYERTCPSASEILVRVPGDPTWLGVLAHTRVCDHGTLRESPLLAGRRPAP